jgi:hypothetical protein
MLALDPCDALFSTMIDESRRWWPRSFEGVLRKAHALVDVRGPAELEQAAAELVGAPLHRALTRMDGGLVFLPWLAALIETAGRAGGAGARYLLHGIAAFAPQPLDGRARTWISRLAGAHRGSPDWLATVADVVPTGAVHVLRDGYGTRFGVLIACRRPGEPGGGAHVYLLDVDACTSRVRAIDGEVHADVEAATAAWRKMAGRPGAAATPETPDPELLAELLPQRGRHCSMTGDESRRMMANYFRQFRRCDDLREALAAAGRPLPAKRPPTEGPSAKPEPYLSYVRPFTDWYAARHAARPDENAVSWLLEEWVETPIESARLGCPPHRVEEVRHQIVADWGDTTAKREGLAMLPDVVRWCAERTGLDTALAQAAITTAGEAPLPDGFYRIPAACRR